MNKENFSEYYKTLSEAAQRRYKEKLDKIDLDKDPYLPRDASNETLLNNFDWPNIEYPDIYNYLINTPSVYTKDTLKAYKSLDAYNYFVSGWISNIEVTPVGCAKNICLIRANVKHSQKLSASPLKPWIAAETNGTIMCAHCTCMAGLGEVCSHISAVLFAVDYNTRMKNSTSATSLPCAWLPPTMQKVPYAQLCDIDFTSSKQKKLKLDESIAAECTQEDQSNPQDNDPLTSQGNKTAITPGIVALTSAETSNFFDLLWKSDPEAAILSVIPSHSDLFVKSQDTDRPPLLSSFFDEKFLNCTYEELIAASEDVFANLSMTDKQARKVEETTRDQANSKDWFALRAGRITASKIRAAVHTNMEKPSVSLIKTICYPELTKYFSKYTQWGCDHEEEAVKEYEKKMKSLHKGLQISPTGLVIHPSYPHLGASPDRILTCDCCGSGVLEVKCPFLCKQKTIMEASEDPKFCLTKDVDDVTYVLKSSHSYYYQIQLQLLLCEVGYCDFVVWAESELVHLRIKPDFEFMDETISKATAFFKQVILPELLGKWFTRTST